MNRAGNELARPDYHDPADAIIRVRSLCLGRWQGRSAVEADRVLTLALTRLLELIGEAVTRVAQDVRDRHPHIAWRDIISLRNRLIHGYDTINFAVLWQIVERDLPPFIRDLDVILEQGVT